MLLFTEYSIFLHTNDNNIIDFLYTIFLLIIVIIFFNASKSSIIFFFYKLIITQLFLHNY